MHRDRLTPLLPPGMVHAGDELLSSVEREGILLPLAVTGTTVVDGVKRLHAAERLGIDDIPVVAVEGNPFLLRWRLNASRSWSLVETAGVYEGLPAEERRDFARSLNLGSSPFLPDLMALLCNEGTLRGPVEEGTLSLAVLRDLFHLKEALGPWAIFLASLKGTAGERRVAASLLKTCALRGALPDLPSVSRVEELVAILTPLARPETSRAAKAFDEAVKSLDLPPGTTLAVDPTLEREGVEVRVWMTRGDLERLDRVKDEIVKLFSLLDIL